jgi:CheY-like chemotaxis protein
MDQPPANPANPIQPKRVLVVDPHATLRTVLAQRLRQDGHLAAAVASAG